MCCLCPHLQQVDTSAIVRRAYASFLGECAQSGSPNVQLLGQVAGQVATLLQDQSPLVTKASLLSCSMVLRAALALLGAQVSGCALMPDSLVRLHQSAADENLSPQRCFLLE